MQAIVANGFIFLSGALGTNTTTIEEQTAEVFAVLLLWLLYMRLGSLAATQCVECVHCKMVACLAMAAAPVAALLQYA